MTIKEKARKFLRLHGIESGGKEEREMLNDIYPTDRLHEIWEGNLIKFAERIAQEEREDILKEIKKLPTGMLDSTPYLSELIEKFKK